MATAGMAQTVLNFPRALYEGQRNTGVAILNPGAYFADVQLTLYGLDGNPVSNGAMNPVSYRVAPKSQLQMSLSELFVSGEVEGWIQASSSSSGLLGFAFNGDYVDSLGGAETATPLLVQVIPLIREDPGQHTDLLVINPGPIAASVNVTFYNQRGEEIGSYSPTLAPHAGIKARAGDLLPAIGPAGATARVTASAAVVATAFLSDSPGSLMFVNGQPIEQAASTRIVPHFMSGNGVDSEVVLSNPGANPSDIAITLIARTAGVPGAAQSFTIPGHGFVALNAMAITGRLFTPFIDGWLRIDSSNAALNGVVRVDTGQYITAVPLQRLPAPRMLFLQWAETDGFFSELNLVNASPGDASVAISLFRADGTLSATKSVTVEGGSRYAAFVRDVFPDIVGQTGGFVYLRSSGALYAMETLAGSSGRFGVNLPPQRTNVDFTPDPSRVLPAIIAMDPGATVVPGGRLRLTVPEAAADAQVLIGDEVMPVSDRSTSVKGTVLTVDLPAIDAGFASLRIRVHGVDSARALLHVVPEDEPSLATIRGAAFYQKVEMTDAGLDLNRTSMVPIRNARVEVLNPLTQGLISVSETDEQGRFNAAVPPLGAVRIRVLSRLRSTGLRVVDNTAGNALYGIETGFDARERSQVLAVDQTRVSGAFNILEMIQRSNELVHLADLSVVPPAPTIFWSVRNTRALVGTTRFNVTSNTAKILGDRGEDSDEFDDAVIIHEYAHLLAARFSRDDSPGDYHRVGDVLDPRLAWSEGWANFFSSAARNDAIYRDSGVGSDGAGRVKVRIDLEDNQPANDKPGYWSEASVGSLLWDMFDSQNDAGDTVQYPMAAIWDAFADLRNNRFVYLPNFLERFLTRYPAETETLRSMVRLRSVDFQPNVEPSVTNAWPRPIAVNEPVQGEVDSFTSKRTNLITSSHFLRFTTTGEALSIRLDITGLGPGGDPNANDLDLFLLDVNGRVLDSSDRGLNGQSEWINRKLPAGTYVIEVRSFYSKAENNERVFNSGKYRLTVVGQ